MTEKFLSPQDIKQLTGACTRKKQMQLLAANRVAFFVNARGWPVVPLMALAGSSTAKQATPPWQPNMNAIGRG